MLAVMFKSHGIPLGLLGAVLVTVGVRTVLSLNRAGLKGTDAEVPAAQHAATSSANVAGPNVSRASAPDPQATTPQPPTPIKKTP